uniref:Glucosidase 2 subunit beta n=1 Tax=Aureoumbra lagunensis TaxID=44058 RepID=A0A6S8A662_9STRA|mmetsp:Transcript_23818/g.30999  ORF Transcript_23818/g.30999 Transcript_23818/m.30999 type:complete len:513 (+) Transcript_23818:1277-2815(+)
MAEEAVINEKEISRDDDPSPIQNEENHAIEENAFQNTSPTETSADSNQPTPINIDAAGEESVGSARSGIIDIFIWLRIIRTPFKLYVLIASLSLLWLVIQKCRNSRYDWRRNCGTRFAGIGDDYCDCYDGRDEALFASTACSDSSSADFVCHSAFVAPFRVPRSKVKDGIVDCCDGSDEGFTSFSSIFEHLTSSSPCYAALEVEVLRLEKLAVQAMQIRKIRQVAIERAKVLAAEARDIIDKARPWVASAQHRIATATTINERQFYQHQLQAFLTSMTPKSAAAEARADVYGHDGAWLSLSGHCFESPLLSDKQTLGGFSSVHPEYYRFRYCPFANITQRRSPSSEGSTEIGENRQVLLGKFRGWIGPVVRTPDGHYLPRPRIPASARLFHSQNRGDFAAGDARVPGHLQLYDGGAICVGNKPRHVMIDFICALENALVAVDEDGTCDYVLEFQTPFACPLDYRQHAHKLYKLRATLRIPWALSLPRILYIYTQRMFLYVTVVFSADPSSIF